jgi:hypothetical protein
VFGRFVPACTALEIMMDLGSIFLILALLMLVGLFVSRPLFEKQRSASAEKQKTSQGMHADSADRERSALLAERDRILNALQELDFDHVLGKIPEEDYPQQRAALLLNGADILRKLDGMQPEQTEAQNAEQRLEAAIAARRADLQAASGNGRSRRVSAAIASPDDDLEVMLANRRRVRQEKAAGFCPKCGRPVQKSDRFCPKCGGQIA